MALVVKAAVEQRTIAGLTRTGSKSDLATMVASLPPDGQDEDDVAMWASFAQTSDEIYGMDTSTIQLESGNKKGNETEKIRIFRDFAGALSRHKTLHKLVELVDDPTTNGKILRIFSILRGHPDQAKKRVLNACLIVWAQNHWKKGFDRDDILGMPQPNYTDKCIKHIFKVFHDQFVHIQHSEMKVFPGSYWFHLAKNFARAAESRPDFGRKPNQASVEHDDEMKLRNNSSPPYRPEENYDDLFALILYKFSRDLFNRGGDEVSALIFVDCYASRFGWLLCSSFMFLCCVSIYFFVVSIAIRLVVVFCVLLFVADEICFSSLYQMVEVRAADLHHSVIEGGLNKGLSQYEMKGTNADKVMTLGLGSKTCLRDESGIHMITENPKDPIWSTYSLLRRLLTYHLPVGYKLQIFLKKAPKSEISRRRAKGDLTEAWWNTSAKEPWKALGKIGKNQPTKMFRAMALRANFTHPENFMARSARRTGITQAAKSGMDPLVLAEKSRHQSIQTNHLYQDPNDETLAKANTALHYHGDDDEEDSKPAAAPSNISIPPSFQAALDLMLSQHHQNQLSMAPASQYPQFPAPPPVALNPQFLAPPGAPQRQYHHAPPDFHQQQYLAPPPPMNPYAHQPHYSSQYPGYSYPQQHQQYLAPPPPPASAPPTAGVPPISVYEIFRTYEEARASEVARAPPPSNI